ncbi:cyclic nucleotide-binding protein [Chloroherpeton thalassium ATCC 35110]|uniref:Cyclic nucleotide-binding protein n=1 Tax=Chloroherpeton thalassium (strain ATCC 35110 / GB-78) TaxID=517418 RepID=B3QWG4_CHLT3|nr:cyclic nucleotide-binding domain-containing protein [Chloroherpeton thalassium]ACF14724.1 cyclic nucleotide-binding protein [Chloroherpeton thalassium ATCC 35110]
MSVFEISGHIAFALIAISYLVKDILWLRILSIIASAAGIVFNYVVPATPLWLVIYWNIGFILVHTFHITLILRERASVDFSEEEKELYQTVFQTFSPVEFMKLLRVSDWKIAQPTEPITVEGEEVPNVMLIYNGLVSVISGGKEVAQLKDGQFIGEMSFIRGGNASATCKALRETRYLSIPKTNLHKLLNRNPAMRTAVHAVLSTDLAKKLSPVQASQLTSE